MWKKQKKLHGSRAGGQGKKLKKGQAQMEEATEEVEKLLGVCAWRCSSGQLGAARSAAAGRTLLCGVALQ